METMFSPYYLLKSKHLICNVENLELVISEEKAQTTRNKSAWPSTATGHAETTHSEILPRTRLQKLHRETWAFCHTKQLKQKRKSDSEIIKIVLWLV